MSFGTALVVIVAIIAFTILKLARHHARQDRLAQGPGGGEIAARQEIEELRERIQVLERIATEGNTLDASETRRISHEIEALRDRQSS